MPLRRREGTVNWSRGVDKTALSAPCRPAPVCDSGHDVLERCRYYVQVPQAGQFRGRHVVASHKRDLAARERGAGHKLRQEGDGLPQREG